MRKCDVKTAAEALAYITDCTLATVCHMAGMRSRKKSEYVRQQAIAQTSIDWMREMGVDYSSTRAREVVDSHRGSVARWAAQWER